MNVKLISIFIIFTVPYANKTQCMLSKELDKTKQTKTAQSSPRITNIPSEHIKETPIIRHESPLAFPSGRMEKNQEMQHIDRLNRIARENQKQIYNSDWYKKSQQELALKDSSTFDENDFTSTLRPDKEALEIRDIMKRNAASCITALLINENVLF